MLNMKANLNILHLLFLGTFLSQISIVNRPEEFSQIKMFNQNLERKNKHTMLHIKYMYYVHILIIMPI